MTQDELDRALKNINLLAEIERTALSAGNPLVSMKAGADRMRLQAALTGRPMGPDEIALLNPDGASNSTLAEALEEIEGEWRGKA